MYLKSVDTRTEAYTALASKHGGLFNQQQWLNIYESGLEVIGIYNPNHELIGAFNVFHQKSNGLKLLRIPPYMPYNALFFNNPALTLANKITFEKEVHRLIANHLKAQKNAITLSAFPPNYTDMQVYVWEQFKVIPNYTYQLALTTNTLFDNFTSEKRKSIRRAEKDALQIVATSDYQLIQSLVEKTFSRKQKTVSATMLQKILNQYANASNSFAFVAYQNNQPSACTFCIYHGQTAYYLLGGYDDKNKHHGAGASCMYQSILKAQKLGLSTFDFEGSMLPEVEKYFREFGGQLVPYYTINKAHVVLELFLKFKKRSIF